MKKYLLAAAILMLAQAADAQTIQAFLYTNSRPTVVMGEVREHWKDELPDIGAGEVITDHRLLMSQGDKRLYLVAVNKNSELFNYIKGYVKNHNGCGAVSALQGPACTTPMVNQILFWNGVDSDEAAKKLWDERESHNVVNQIARAALKYRVETTCEGAPCTRTVTVGEAIDTYDATIDREKVLPPMRLYK